MDNLFCNEEHVWLMLSPTAAIPDQTQRSYNNNYDGRSINYMNTCFYTTKQDREEAFEFYLSKEPDYMPKPGFVDLLDSDHFIRIGRCKAIHWLIQTRQRLNLSPETLSNAVNYLDRFIALHQCHGWKYWMVELLSVACLSTASKFGETSPLALHDIQIKGLDHTFQPKLILEMELNLLQTIEWRLNCTTPYSYVELMIQDIDFLMKPLIIDSLSTRLTELLCALLLDCKLLAFRPSVITVCVLSRILEKLIPTYDAHLNHFITLIQQDQMENLIKCHEVMDNKLIDYLYDILSSEQPYELWTSSLVTVVSMAPLVERCDPQVDELFCIFKMPSNIKRCKKRKRIDLHE